MIGQVTSGQRAVRNQPQTSMRFRGGLEAPIVETRGVSFEALQKPLIPGNGAFLGNIFGWVNHFQFTKILLALWQMQMKIIKMILDSVLNLSKRI